MSVPTVKVLLFGYLKERCGLAELSISAQDTDGLRENLEARLPILQGLNYLMAVNQIQVQGNEVLQDGDEVALMPPFAGG